MLHNITEPSERKICKIKISLWNVTFYMDGCERKRDISLKVFLHGVEMKITNMTFRQCVCVCNNTVIQITTNQHKPKNASVSARALHFC